MPRTPNTDGDIRTLVDEFTNQITTTTKRIALEELLAKLNGAVSAPRRRGPGRPRGSAAKQRGRPGKFTPEQMEQMGSRLLIFVKQNPGSRGEQIAQGLKTDANTMRLPMKALIKAKLIKTKGQRRGMAYFPR